MQPASPTPLAELVQSLAGLHQAHHQALLDMKLEQEDRFRLLVQVQDEDRRAIRSLLGREGTPVAAPSIAHIPLMKMGPHDDPEAFVDPFEKTAEACGWARTQWPVRLFPPADGGGAGGSPTAACREPPGLRRPKAGHPATRRPKPRAATVNTSAPWNSGTAADHLWWLSSSGTPAASGSWPNPATSREWSTWWCWSSSSPDYPGEQPSGSSATARRRWHRPSSWRRTIWRRAPCPLSLPPSLPSPSLSHPVPAPRSRLQGAPRAPPRSGNGQAARHLSTVLSPAIPCPSFCRWGGGKAWAGLLEMRGSGALPGPLSHDGGGIAGPGPRLPGGCPRSSRAVPDTYEYQGGYISGLGGFGL